MDNNISWPQALVRVVVVIGLSTLLFSPVRCVMNRQDQIAKAISDGKDPIAVRCALSTDMGNDHACLIKAAKP